MYLDYKFNFKSVHILDSINKCHYSVYACYYVSAIIDSESGWEIE